MTATEMGADDLESLLNFVGDLDKVDLAPTAGGTAHELRSTTAHTEGLQKLPGNGNLLGGWGGEGKAHGVAYTLREQHGKRRDVLNRSLTNGARLRNAKMKRHMRQDAGKLAIGENRRGNVVDLGGENDVFKAALLEMPHEGDGTLDKLLGLRQVFARVDPLVEGAGVHSDANGDSSLPSRIDDGVNAIERANVSGVDANASGTATSSLDGKAVVEVYVRNDGDWRLGARLGKSVESIGVRNRYANDFTAKLSEVMDLRKRRCGIESWRWCTWIGPTREFPRQRERYLRAPGE